MCKQGVIGIIRWLKNKINKIFGKVIGDIKFYIADELIDLEQYPKLVYNWIVTDFENPTITKNSFSKTITIPNTPRNAKVLGHFWNLERYQLYNGNTGASFNPTYRVPFTIYINGNVFESGYLKLTGIKKENNQTTYEITCYGGLGNFLYNLSTDWNTGEKKTLADLTYYVEDTALIEPSSNFVISKETVKDAWDNIDAYSSKWSVINFCPDYSGKPDKMDANKGIVNYNGIDDFVTGKTEDGVSYEFLRNRGFCLANLPKDLDVSQSCDYRSWCQRPVIKAKAVIDAIARKENNRGEFDSGYDVVLDPEFFNSSNPYYDDTWMTLPAISKLNIKTNGETESAYTASFTKCYTDNANSFEFVFALNQPVESYGCTAELNFDLLLNVSGASLSSLEDILYPSGVWYRGGKKQMKFTNTYILQGFSTDSDMKDAIALEGTDVYWLQYNRTDRETTAPYTYEMARYYAYNIGGADSMYGYIPRFTTDDCQVMEGYFVRYNGRVYRWNNPIYMSVPLPIGTRYFRVRLDRKTNNVKHNNDLRSYLYNSDWYWTEEGFVSGATIDKNTVFGNRNFKIKTGDLSNFFSGIEIKVKDLLNTGYSPAEWLMDYCRMFGLYIHKDLFDNKIYIDTRNTYFKRNQVVDITENIDYSKEISVSPVACDSGYYRMKDSFYEGDCYKDYNNKFGKVYGSKVIATGYEFDANTKDLISSKFKGAVQTRKNGIYYFKPIGDKMHPYIYDGVTYNLYANGNPTGDTIDLNINKKNIAADFQPYNSLPFYDFIDRPEFAEGDKGLDGTNVFLFRQGDTDVSGYACFLTDDTDVMATLNNKPCWLITNREYDMNGNKIAIELSTIPHFSRYWTSSVYLSSASTQNNILYSMDFGSPRQLYLLNFVDYEKSNLYSQFYKKYYEDLYDVNTKVVTLYYKPDEILDADALRKFYWFDNSIWRLNRVIDYCPVAYDTVKCEFVKVQDLDNMTNEIPSKELDLVVVLSQYSIDGSGGTIVATVTTSDMGPWSVENWDYDDEISISPLAGVTDGTFNITVPTWYGPNDRTVGITVTAGDISRTVYFVQTPLQGVQSISLTAATPISSATTAITYNVNAQPAGTVYLMSGSTVLNQQNVSGSTTNNFTVGTNTTTSAKTYTLKGVTQDGQHSATTQVVQNGSSTPEPPTPSEDYTIQYGDISIDQDHSDLTGYSLTGGTITILNNNSTLKMVGVNGDENGLTLEGNTPWSASSTALTNCTINVDFGNLQWNQFLNPDVKIIVTINGDAVINMQYSQDGLSNGIPNVDLTQYANNQSIRLDVGVIFRTAL